MPGFLSYSPVAQVRSIAIQIGICSAEIAIVVHRNTSVAEHPDRGDFVSVVTQGFALFTAAQAKEAATEARIFVEARAAPFPATAVPVAARWPGGTGLWVPPTWTVGSAGAWPWAAPAIAADDEDRAASLLNPQALPINTPGLPLNARRTADLAFHADLIGIVATAVLAIVIVGFASDALLSRRECWDYEKNKSHSEKAEKRIESHELAPVEFECQSADLGRAFWKRRAERKKPSTVGAEEGQGKAARGGLS